MNFAVYTMHNSSTIGDLVAITKPNKLEYCRRHGYSYHEEEWTQSLFPGFERLPVLIYLLQCGHYDWVFWLGSDALITNLNVNLESLVDKDHGIVMATDAWQVQMDSFLIQRSHGGLSLLQSVWEHHASPIGQFMEQSTLDFLMWQPEFLNVVKLVPQRTMNSYRYSLYSDLGQRYQSGIDCLGRVGEWEPGDFVFHVPGRPLETKLSALRDVARKVQR